MKEYKTHRPECPPVVRTTKPIGPGSVDGSKFRSSCHSEVIRQEVGIPGESTAALDSLVNER